MRPRITAVYKDIRATDQFVVLTNAPSMNQMAINTAIHVHVNSKGVLVAIWCPCYLKVLKKNAHVNAEISFECMPEEFQAAANDALELYEKHFEELQVN